MNIQRSFVEGGAAPIGGQGEAGADLLSDFLRRTAPAPSLGGPVGPPARRIPEDDIVVVGRETASAAGSAADTSGKLRRRPRAARVRTTLLLTLAAYYMAWGLYEGIRRESPQAIRVDPTLNSRTVIT